MSRAKKNIKSVNKTSEENLFKYILVTIIDSMLVLLIFIYGSQEVGFWGAVFATISVLSLTCKIFDIP